MSSTISLVPVSLTASGAPGWGQFGGTVAAGSMGDLSDSSGVSWDTVGRSYAQSILDFRMPAITVPAGEVVSRWRPSARSRRTVTGAGGAGTLTPRVGPLFGTPVGLSLLDGVWFESSFSPPGRPQPGWSQPARLMTAAELTDVVLRVQVSGGYGFALQISEAGVTVETTTVPTAPTVSAPTGTLNATTRPAIVWAHNDGDGKPQADAQVAVYTAAQYGVVGFDPDPAVGVAPVWSSGPGGSAATASGVTVGVDLANSTTYRAYVRTMATTAGGAPLWSPWGYSQFALSLVMPGPPTSLVVSRDPAGVATKVTAVSTAAPPAAGSWSSSQVLLERSTDGVTWQRVWVRPGAGTDADGPYGIAWNAAAGTTVYDYECPRGDTVSYRARQVWLGATGVLASAPLGASVLVPAGDWRLVPVSAVTSGVALPLLAVDGYGEQVDSQSEVYNPPAGGAFVIRRPWSARAVTAVTVTESTTERDALLAVLRAGILLVASAIPEDSGFSRQWYAVVTGTVGTDPITATTWRCSFSLIEVQAPGVLGV